MEQCFGHGASAVDARRITLYTPKNRPGFVAWATAFAYPDGGIGLSFKETLKEKNPDYVPPRLEFAEAVGAPVSYCSVECGSENERSYRVYCVSRDGGESFTETGRCPLEEGSFCNVALEDGTIVGYDVPRINVRGTGWSECILIRKSTDGGSSWTQWGSLLEGCAPYLWRVRRLRDGTIVLLTCLYGTPWGEGKQRATRNTMLPGESYIHKIQTCFLTSRDGLHFTGPHYVLPGIGAHEYDMVECLDGRLLFIAGDVQSTPVGRQFVERRGDRFLNGTLYGISRGAPEDPQSNPQGGFVPETMAMLPDGTIIGSRRNKPYSASRDYGENWYEVDGLSPSLYQPFLMALEDGTVLNFGHVGGDSAFGQEDMTIGADRFRLENHLPEACKLSLTRLMDEDKTHYLNAFEAKLTAQGKPVSGQRILFRVQPAWNDDGSYNIAPQREASMTRGGLTDSQGVARLHLREFDGIPDIHFYYNIDAAYLPQAQSAYAPCTSPLMCVSALTPRRRCPYPFDAYMAGGTVYLSPEVEKDIPGAAAMLKERIGRSTFADDELPGELTRRLIDSGVLVEEENSLRLYRSIHSPQGLAGAETAQPDWYV